MNAKDIQRVLRRRYGANNATCIAFEVAAGTGALARRRVDAVVMDLWPSRGLTLHAMEIKVSVSDLKRELADGSKAEEIAQYCDLFSLVVPKGLISPNRMNEVPKAWGVIEVDGNENLVFSKQAARTRARAVDRPFMASMLRAGYGVSNVDVEAALRAGQEARDKTFTARVDEAVERRTKSGALWEELMAMLKAEGITYAWDKEVLASVVFALRLRSSMVNIKDGVARLVAEMRGAGDKVNEAWEKMVK